MSTDTPAVQVYSDYVCPFCYLGRHSLSQYEAERGSELEIDWRPFDLRAHKRGPDGAIDRDVDDGKDDEYYERARENVRRLRERYGVDMSLDIARDVDSLPAQLVSLHVKETSTGNWRDLDAGIFEALWVDGRDIGDRAVLRDVAEGAGLDATVVDEALEDEDLRQRLRRRFDEARRRGVTGVPTFVHDGTAARGAVPPEQLRRLVEGV